MKAPRTRKIYEPWRPDDWVISIDPRLQWPSLVKAESFWLIRRAMDQAGIFRIPE